MCQALGLSPAVKYQSEGGPSPEQIITLLRRAITPQVIAETEVGRFVDGLALNWLIAGTDAHAKNYPDGSWIALPSMPSVAVRLLPAEGLEVFQPLCGYFGG